MRSLVRIVASLLLTVATGWIAFEAFVSTAGFTDLSDLALLPVNVLLNAWPALGLIALAFALIWIVSRMSRRPAAS